MEYPIQLPGHENLKLTLRTAGAFSASKVMQEGVPLAKAKGSYTVMLPGGETLLFKIKLGFDLYSPRIEFGGAVIEIVPALPIALVVWAYLPLVLVFLGGAIGGLCGGAATYGMLATFHSRLPRVAKALLGLALPVVAFFIYLLVAGSIALLTRPDKM